MNKRRHNDSRLDRALFNLVILVSASSLSYTVGLAIVQITQAVVA